MNSRFPIFISLVVILISTASGVEPAAAALPINFELLHKVVHQPDKVPNFPKQLTDLIGKKVRITGFVSPYDESVMKMKKLILTPRASSGCFFCNPPEENEVVFVRLPPKGKPMVWESDTITVEGILRLKGQKASDEEAEQFLFAIDDAVVVSKK